jgi:hypothetical protein
LALLTLLSCGFVTVGAFVFAIGLLLVNHFSRSPFQKFARYCSFGKEPGHHGTASWVDGDFSEWKDDPEGLDRQIRHLMALICEFKVSGSHEDTHTVVVQLGCLPPKAELEVAFVIEYDDGRTLCPRYSVNLEDGKTRMGGDAAHMSRFTFQSKGHPRTILIGADRPDQFRLATVRTSTCEVKVVYGKEHGSASIPSWGSLKYPIRTSSHSTRGDEVSSLEAKKPGHGGGHGAEHASEHTVEHGNVPKKDHGHE